MFTRDDSIVEPKTRLRLVSEGTDLRGSRLGLRADPSLLSDLQSLGMRLLNVDEGVSRTGGAGPSDHKAVKIAGQTVMVPVFTHSAFKSPFVARRNGRDEWVLLYEGIVVAPLEFPRRPRFYEGVTRDGIPYWKIATLHSHDVLATTILQNCVRYANRETACQFCAIGLSLHARSTIARKTPEQLAEVAKAAVTLDGVRHMVLTTGTPPGDDRGAAVLAESAQAIKGAVDLPIQGQCEPPDDDAWFGKLAEAGIDSLGMHLEAVSESVRERIMPGKANVSVGRYLQAFDAAVRVFGRGQVSTYILAGLGDSEEQIVAMSERLVALGVYPFVVPFVPIGGTPLENHPAPAPAFMRSLLDKVARVVERGGLSSSDIKAGCGRCGACSSLRAREEEGQHV
jgi:radical SAM protein (TIGR04043 family)